MKISPVKSLLSLLLLGGLFAFNACQKEGFDPKATQAPTTVSDRSPSHRTYGVTVYTTANPSVIVEIDEATGAVLTSFPVFVDNGSGPIFLDDIKGIARTDYGQYFITTGPGCFPDIYDNNLLKVNVNSPFLPLGQCSYFGSQHMNGPISDLEYDPSTQNFYGLLNNTNFIVEISGPGNNYANYSMPAQIFGIQSRSLSGLSLVRDNNGVYFVGAASRPGAAIPAQLYTVPAGGGLATLMTNLAPAGDFAGGHCGIGFDLDLNHLAVNRANPSISALVPGLSEVNPWAVPMAIVTGTNVWGGGGFNYEDLTSYTQ